MIWPLTAFLALVPLPPPQDAAASIAALEHTLATNGSNAAVLRALARAYASLDDPRAEATFQQALAATSDDAALRRDHVEYLWRKHRDEAGNAEMERVLARSPSDAELRGRYGEMLMQQNRFVDAAAELSRACALAAKSCTAERLGLWASALLETGRFPESARIWSRAIAAAPDRAEPHAGLGRLRLLQGDDTGARAELAIAVKREPGDASLRVDYGRSLERSGDATAAEAEYREALRLDPSFSAAHYALGTLLARLGRADEANAEIVQYQTAFAASQSARQRNGARRAQLSLGWTRLEAKDAEGAIAAFSGLGNDPEALRGSGEALLAMGRRDEARASFERAAALAPSDPRIQWALARARGAEGP
ncbi:MAG TPA: tetratricopeptide repeat protein [Thermoanaerobaculia bacterium]